MTASALSPPDVSTGRRVVVGMDDDPASLDALRFAATEAAYRGGEVVAIHVWRYPTSWGYPMVWPEDASPDKFFLAELTRRIAQVHAERARAGEAEVPITAQVVEGVDALALTTAAESAGLLVLGARHHNRFLGSVSQACINHPVCPVVVVPHTEASP